MDPAARFAVLFLTTMAKQLNVPLDAQPSTDTCWHSSAQMIWWYWQGQTGRQGPMNTMADSFNDNKPIMPFQFVTLAAKAGLKKVPGKIGNLSAAALEQLLNKYGPLWCAGYWYGPGHIIVLTGVSGNTIHLNDPDGGVRKTQSVAWFNQKLATSVDGCLMHKNPAAY